MSFGVGALHMQQISFDLLLWLFSKATTGKKWPASKSITMDINAWAPFNARWANLEDWPLLVLQILEVKCSAQVAAVKRHNTIYWNLQFVSWFQNSITERMNYIALEPQIKWETFHTACHCSGFGVSNIWNVLHSVTNYSNLTTIQSAPKDLNAQAAQCWVWEHVSCYRSPTSGFEVLPKHCNWNTQNHQVLQAIASQFTNSEEHFSEWATGCEFLSPSPSPWMKWWRPYGLI